VRDRWDWLDIADFPDSLAALAAVIVAVIALALAWFVVVPLLLLALDAVLVAVLVIGAVLARLLLRRTWTVEATTTGASYRWKVVGYRSARKAVEEAVGELRLGVLPSASQVTTS
jgi:hypothetical protein